MNVLGEAMDATCKVLGHRATLNRLNTNPLQDLGESADEKKKGKTKRPNLETDMRHLKVK